MERTIIRWEMCMKTTHICHSSTANKIEAEQKTVIIDLNERLSATSQSCAEANELINNQMVALSELKAQLNDERNQRREEKKAAIDLKAAMKKVLSDDKHDLMLYSQSASTTSPRVTSIVDLEK